MRVHRDRLGQHIIQMQPRPAVYHEGSLGNNVLVHLMQRVTELRHTHAVQIEHHRIEIPCVFPISLPTEIRNRGHDRKLRVLDVLQLFQFICDHMTVGFAVSLDLQRNTVFRWYHQSDTISLGILKVTSALKRSLRENLPVKLKRLHRLQILSEMGVLLPVKRPLPLQRSLLIHRHKIPPVQKRKRSKKKSPLRRDPPAGGKGGRGSQRASPAGP